MDYRCNDTVRGSPKHLEQNLSHCHFVDHKCHMDWFGIELGHLL